MIYLFDRTKKLQKIIPRKHIIDAKPTVVRNGIYQLAVEVPLFHEDKKGTRYNYQKSVGKATFAGHYDVNNRFQLYKIYSRNITANEQGEFLIFDGVHIFFDEAKAMGNIHDRRFRDSEAKAPADAAFNSIGWHVIDYDVTDRHDINFYRASVTDAWNDLISTYGVEFDYELQFDGRKIISKNIIMKKQIGQWTGQRFAYGTNVLTLTQEQDESEVYTAAVGRGRGEEAGDGFGPRLEFGDIAWSKDGITKPVGQNYIELPSATAEYGFIEDGVVKPRIAPEVIFENIEDKKKLADATYYWLLENCLPKATWKTEVARIGNLKLGDTVGVLYKAAGIIKRARVEKIEYNLLDPELSKLTLGDFHHFENRQMKRINAQIKRLGRDSNDRITRIKNEWNAWIDNQFIAAKNELEQAIIDANAEVEAMRVEMTDEIASVRKDMSDRFESEKHSAYEEAQKNYDAIDHRITNVVDSTRTEMEQAYNDSVNESKEYAEQQAQEKASEVQGNLDSFKDSHQQLYDEVTGNILDIDTFLGDKSKTLKQQFADVESDFKGLETELSGVEGDLNSTKTDLQKQLDDARADFENLEIGGRNWFSYDVLSNRDNWNLFTYSTTKEVIQLEPNTEYTFHAKEIKEHLEGEWGVLALADGTNGTPAWGSEDYKQIFTIYNHRGPTTKLEDVTRKFITPDSGKIYFSYYDHNRGTSPEGQWVTDKLVNAQIFRGDILQDWTPAPEDTDNKITTMHQQIEFIDGQLSAKLEQTDLLPINNKITEYGNSLTANAQSIESLISKTELHDGDITKWSNQTTANAENITSALSRISNTESGLTKAQTDITANADGLSALITRVGKTEKGIESLTTNFSIEAGRIETLISKTDGHESQLTNIVTDYEKIEQTVAKNDDWLGTHGSNLLQTVEGFEQKAWRTDIDNIVIGGTNLVPHTNFESAMYLKGDWKTWGPAKLRDYIQSEGYLLTLTDNPNTSSSGTFGLQTPILNKDVVSGKKYTVSFKVNPREGLYKPFDYMYLMNVDSEVKTDGESTGNTGLSNTTVIDEGELRYDKYSVVKHELTFTANFSGRARVMIGYTFEPGEYTYMYIKDIKVEEGTKATAYSQAPTDFLQLSQLEITPDYWQLGSSRVDGNSVSSILRGSPDSIDAIVSEMNLTGNLNVKGQIETIAMNAVRGDFAELFAKQVEANVIDVDHISGRTAWFERLYILSTNVERLTAQHVFTDAVHAKSLDAIEANIGRVRTAFLKSDVIEGSHIKSNTIEIKHLTGYDAILEMLMARSVFSSEVTTLSLNAVEANIGSIRSQILTSNVVQSKHIQSGNALIDKIFSSTGMFERMMAKSGFVTTLNTVSIDTDQLTIRRADGGVLFSNGTQKFGSPIITKPFPSASVTFDDVNYVTTARGSQTFERAYGEHSGRYANFSIRVGLRYDSDDASSKVGLVIRPGTTPSGVSMGTHIEEVMAYRSGMNSHTISIRLPVPTFGAISWTLEFYRIGDNSPNYVQVRSERCWVSA